MTFYTKIARQLYDCIWSELFHDPGCYRVHRIGQSPFQRNCETIIAVRILRSPILYQSKGSFVKSGGRFHDFMTGRIAFTDGSGVYKWFEGRSNLAFSGANMVVHEMPEVDATYPGFHKTGAGFNGNHTGLQKAFVITDAVHR